MQELDIIRTFLGRVRKRRVARRLTETGVFVLIGAASWITILLITSTLIPTGWLSTLLVWVALLGGLGALFWHFFLRDALALRNERALARSVEDVEPSFHNDLVTALQYGDALARDEAQLDRTTSVTLVKAHLRATARATERFRRKLDLLTQPRDLVSPAQLLLALLLTAAGVAYFAPSTVPRTAAVLFGEAYAASAFGEQSPHEEMPRERLVANLTLRLTPPSYTQLPARRMRNTSGNIQAYAGTWIQIEGRTKLGLEPELASLIFEREDGTTESYQLEVQNNRIKGSFTALHAGTYRFKIVDTGQRTFDNDIPRTLELLPDLAPKVEIEQPTGVREVTVDEVITFRITASDDFGLSEVALLYTFGREPGAEPERIPIARIQRQASWAGEYQLQLSSLDLRPKDTITIVAEARDNDDVARPKAAQSAPVVLRVASPEDRHEALIRDQEKLLEDFILLLADYLENPILKDEPGFPDADGRPDTPASENYKTLYGQAQQISQKRYLLLRRMADILTRMESDELLLKRDYNLFKGLHEQLYTAHRDGSRLLESLSATARRNKLTSFHVVRMGRSRIDQVELTEHAIIQLEELITSEWLDAAQMTVQAIRDTKKRLEELIKQYQETQDPELKKEIMREIARLKQQLSELSHRLNQQLQKLPREHLNAEALKEKSDSSMKDMKGTLDDLERMLEEGDIEGLLASLEQLDQDLDSMLSMIDQGTSSGGGSSGPSALDQKANELMDDLNDLSAAEAELEKDTSELRKDMRERTSEELNQELDAFIEEQQGLLDAMKQDLAEMEEGNLTEKDRAAISEIQRALDTAEQRLATRDIEGTQPAIERLQGHVDDAAYRLERSKRGLPKSSAARKDYQASQKKLGQVQNNAEQLLDNVGKLLERAQPQPTADDAARMQQLAQRQRDIDAKAEALGQKIDEAGEQFPFLEDQMKPSLEQGRRFMKGAAEKLDDAQPTPGLEDERQAMRQLHAMKRQLQQTLQKERMEASNQGNSSEEAVEIPDKDANAPKAFREDIMEAMKEKGIEPYEDENKLYYRSLVE